MIRKGFIIYALYVQSERPHAILDISLKYLERYMRDYPETLNV